MTQKTIHEEQLTYLRKIEGQIRGIQKMIKEKRYCIDILTQLNSIIGAISRVEEKILAKHLEGCVSDVIKKGSPQAQREKILEITKILKRHRR